MKNPIELYSKLSDFKWDESQVYELNTCIEQKIDFSPWMDPKWDADQMKEFRLCTIKGIDYTPWFNTIWNKYQMQNFCSTGVLKIDFIIPDKCNFIAIANSYLFFDEAMVHISKIDLFIKDINSDSPSKEYHINRLYINLLNKIEKGD